VLRIRDVVVGLLALAALVAMIAGVPWVLMTIAPIGLPHSLPTWDTVLAYATRPDDGTLSLEALTIIAWTGWAAFTLSTLLEALARARGIGTIRLPILALPQHAAAALIAAVAMGVPSVGTTALRLADHPTIVATAPRTVGTLDATYASDSSPTPATTSTDHPTVVVHRHDTLWGLAEQHLGDGRRYVEIAQLNYGRPQSDGATLDDSHWLHPGWVLQLPIDADTLGEPASPNSVVVRDGDTLWDIARDHLGNPEHYREIFDLNRGRPQPDGGRLQMPDLIRPGWHLELPPRSSTPTPALSPAPVRPVPRPTPTAASTPTWPSAPPITPRASGSAPAVASNDVAADPETDPTATSEQPATVEPRSSPVPQAVTASMGDDDWVWSVLGLTGITCAALLTQIAIRRRSQQRHRKPGQVVPLPAPDTAAVERRLRAAHDPHTLGRIAAALGALEDTCHERGRTLPALAAVLVTPTRLDLVMDDDGTPFGPFTEAGTRVWRYSGAAGSPELSGRDDTTAGFGSCPYPGLVSLGVTGDALVLVNLEAAGTLTLRGPADDVATCCAATVRTCPRRRSRNCGTPWSTSANPA
jgi:nucleoid-associated protein YgaU